MESLFTRGASKAGQDSGDDEEPNLAAGSSADGREKQKVLKRIGRDADGGVVLGVDNVPREKCLESACAYISKAEFNIPGELIQKLKEDLSQMIKEMAKQYGKRSATREKKKKGIHKHSIFRAVGGFVGHNFCRTPGGKVEQEYIEARLLELQTYWMRYCAKEGDL
ncbi:hypothetical protein NliqN6_6797 [Naganishia liquefaciens]|uniref:Uncharacterized protein n=1 Tax=Naganishia liquefaciens TaxID=104408 RepID=A0A8H3U053_9TREE|nr:hypothetical protein NliqN6_6797 [Naganishia liquefaciens]